jgi:hypothetical protein
VAEEAKALIKIGLCRGSMDRCMLTFRVAHSSTASRPVVKQIGTTQIPTNETQVGSLKPDGCP